MTAHPAGPVLLADVDNCMIDWTGPFGAWVHQTLGLDIDPAGPDSYCMTSWLSMPEAEVAALIKRFFREDAWRLGCLRGYPDAKQVLPQFQAAGRRIIGVTTYPAEEPFPSLRRLTLTREFGRCVDEIHYTGLYRSKAEVLAAYPATFWVEDRFEGALEGLEAGHTPLVLRRPWNRREEATHPLRDKVLWVNDWHEVACVVAALEHSLGDAPCPAAAAGEHSVMFEDACPAV